MPSPTRLPAPVEGFSGGYFFQVTGGRTLSADPHSHDFYEILAVLEGQCVHNVNGVPFTCPAGRVTLLRPGDVHFVSGQAPDTNVLGLSVHPDEMRKFLTAYRLEPEREAMPPCYDLAAEETVHLLRLCQEASPACPLLLGRLLAAYAEGYRRQEEPLPAAFAAACAAMHQPENAAEGVPAFLRLSHFSHAQLCRMTRRWLHTTPVAYVSEIRLTLAYAMLVDGDLPPEVIGETVGYASFSHFCKRIKARYHRSPAAIRRSARSAPRTV